MSRLKKRKHLLWIIPVISLVFCCAMLTYPSMVARKAESLALAITPPQYPESDLVKQSKVGSVGLNWKHYTYYTSDDLETVLEFMQNSDWKLVEGENSLKGTPMYSMGKCNTDWWSNQVDYLYGSLPCAIVVVFQDIPEAPGTFIEISINWPNTSFI